MEVISYLHAPVALTAANEPPIPVW